jgi:glycosyltransferase involved in cell wall biosynthesis
MKIAIFVPSWPPGSSANGIVTYAAQLVPALRKLGHDVFVITPNLTAPTPDAYTLDLNQIPLTRSLLTRLKSRFRPEQAFFDASVERLLSAVRQLKARYALDVLEIEESFGWSWRIAQEGLVPLVVRLHGPWFLTGGFDQANDSGSRERIALEGRGICAATVVTAPSADVLQKVRTYYETSLDRARIIPNPISVDAGSSWQMGTCDSNRILFVGRFDRRKGGDIVLRAFAALAEHYPNLRLSFVGPDCGFFDDGKLLSFDQFASKYLPAHCRPRIDYRGQIGHRDVMAMRSEHLFTIVASQFEILPYAVLEAMSLGCPIVASRVGGIPELIVDQRNGLLFTSQNTAELLSACRRLLDDQALASSLGQQAWQDCITFFSPQRIAAETIGAYQTAVEYHRARNTQ